LGKAFTHIGFNFFQAAPRRGKIGSYGAFHLALEEKPTPKESLDTIPSSGE
jgi:hypothetical protein